MATKKISQKHFKTIAIVGGVLAAVAIVMIFRSAARARGRMFDHNLPPADKQPQPIQSPPSAFPIKVGSRGEMVRQLQGYIGVEADGIFGPKTAAALLAKTGKTSIISQADFDATINKLAAVAKTNTDASRAEKLVRDWNANKSLIMIANVTTAAIGITEDIYGSLTANGKSTALIPGYKYGRPMYELISATQAGFLKFKVTSGKDAGLYKIDPNKVSLG